MKQIFLLLSLNILLKKKKREHVINRSRRSRIGAIYQVKHISCYKISRVATQKIYFSLLRSEWLENSPERFSFRSMGQKGKDSAGTIQPLENVVLKQDNIQNA